MVTTANPPPKGDQITIKSKTIKEIIEMEAKTPQFPQMLIREIAIRCGCTPNKVSGYLRKHNIQPVGSILPNAKAHHPSNLYEFTPYMEDYLLSIHKSGAPVAEYEKERIAKGWLTIYEVAAAWNCSCYKAFNILTESNAPIRWEYGNPYNGRKFYKMPEHTSRDPSKVHYNNVKEDDWLDSVRSKEVKDMVLDERRGKSLIGKRVTIQEGRRVFSAMLVAYNMCWFIIRINGKDDKFRHNEAKVLKEAE
jgi:hypothetical protein